MGSRGARAQRSASAGGRAPELELERTGEASPLAAGAASTPPPAPPRAPARSAHQPRERARRRTSPGSSGSSGRRSPGKHQSDARFQERAASGRRCRRTRAVGGQREAVGCPAADRPPAPRPLPSPATSAASHRAGSLLRAPPTAGTWQGGGEAWLFLDLENTWCQSSAQTTKYTHVPPFDQIWLRTPYFPRIKSIIFTF